MELVLFLNERMTRFVMFVERFLSVLRHQAASRIQRYLAKGLMIHVRIVERVLRLNAADVFRNQIRFGGRHILERL